MQKSMNRNSYYLYVRKQTVENQEVLGRKILSGGSLFALFVLRAIHKSFDYLLYQTAIYLNARTNPDRFYISGCEEELAIKDLFNHIRGYIIDDIQKLTIEFNKNADIEHILDEIRENYYDNI